MFPMSLYLPLSHYLPIYPKSMKKALLVKSSSAQNNKTGQSKKPAFLYLCSQQLGSICNKLDYSDGLFLLALCIVSVKVLPATVQSVAWLD